LLKRTFRVGREKESGVRRPPRGFVPFTWLDPSKNLTCLSREKKGGKKGERIKPSNDEVRGLRVTITEEPYLPSHPLLRKGGKNLVGKGKEQERKG